MSKSKTRIWSLIKCIESYSKDWIGPLRSNRQVIFDGEQKWVDTLEQCIDTEERKIDHGVYNIWTKTLPVSK